MSGFSKSTKTVVAIAVFSLIGVGWHFWNRQGPPSTPGNGGQSKERLIRPPENTLALIHANADRVAKGAVTGESPSVEEEISRARKARDGKALHAIALRFEASKDYARAGELLREAADLGHGPSTFRSGFYAEHSVDDKPDAVKAKGFYEKAAEQGYADGYAAIAKMYIRGEVVVPDSQIAADYIEKGIKAGSMEALFVRGTTLLASHPGEALQCFLEAAGAGNSSAQQMLSRLYKDGIGVPRDEKLALEWARVAASGGEAGAQVDLAKLLLRTEVGVADNEKIVNEAAANLVSADSQQNPRAASEILRIAMSTPPKSVGDVLEVREMAIEAFTRGEKDTSFAVAMTYAMTKEDGLAKAWLATGAGNNDWRSLYARELMRHVGASLSQAIGTVAKASYQEFYQFHAQYSPRSRQGIIAPTPVNMTTPVFPPGLEMLGTKGSVTVEFIVNEKGVPTAIQVLDASHQELAESVKRSVAEWRYKPAIKNGSPIAQRVRTPINFHASK